MPYDNNIVQGIEYSVSSFTISDGIFGTSFFFATGFLCKFCFFFNYYVNIYYNSYFNFVNKRLYSTASPRINVAEFPLSPYWVTGFADAESSFSLKLSKKSTLKSGWTVVPEFRIELHYRDILLLRRIKYYFGIGIISEYESSNKVVYSVQSLRDIVNVIIPHFDKYPLITQKNADYLLFKQAINLLNSKVHKDLDGILRIVSIKASMNSGLSDKLTIQFPTVIPELRPKVNSAVVMDPNWLAGFVDGEGCFYVNVTKSKSYSVGFRVGISFSISQHIRDEFLLTKFMDYLGCGNIEKVSTRSNGVTFVVYKFSDLIHKIIPFFHNYPLLGVKSMDFQDFCEVAKIMADKGHLTPEGLKKIKSFKSGMNTGIIYN